MSAETGRLLPRTGNQLLSSSGSQWRGVLLEQLAPMPLERANVVPIKHLIVVQLHGSARFVWRGGSMRRSVVQPPGFSSFFPAFSPYSVSMRDTGWFLSLAVEPEYVACAAGTATPASEVQFVARQGVDDPLLRGLAFAFKSEVEAGYPGGRWYGDALTQALAVHLIRHYAAPSPPLRSIRGGLSPVQWRKAVQFIERNLAHNFGLSRIAGAAGLSPFHFSRRFKRSCGFSPHQYVIRRRVQRARELLLITSSSIADVALQVGFCEQSHLSAHFRRIYGTTPRAFCRQFVPGYQFS